MSARIRILGLLFFLHWLSAGKVQAQVPDDARWDYRFALPGVQGQVAAMAFDANHVYIGGNLQSVAGIAADAVADFDGQQVTALPDGPKQDSFQLNVLDMKMFGDRLCVAGFFTNVNHLPAGGFGVWRSNHWEATPITNGNVYSLASPANGGVLLGGRIYLPGFTNPVVLARWDGTAWENLNSELPPSTNAVIIQSVVRVEALPDGNAIAELELVENTPPPNSGLPSFILARCDPGYNWHNMAGPDGDTNGLGEYSLCQFQGQLIAGGSFTNSTSSAMRNIALWNGSDWQPIGSGLDYGVIAAVGNQQNLFAAIQFIGADGLSRTRVMRWNGVVWSQLGGEDFRANPPAYLHLDPSGDLYYTGTFSGIGSIVSSGIIRWNGSQWEPVFQGNFQGISGPVPLVRTLHNHAGKIFMGGVFASAGSVFSQAIAQWDGYRWQSVGSGIQGPPTHQVFALASLGSELYVGGRFTNAGGVTCANIARWNGINWFALDAGVDATVTALATLNGDVFAGGAFTNASGVVANNIARWDGSQWHAMSGGCNSNVFALTAWRSNLYVGGRFTTAGGTSARGIACWDGSNWLAVGGSVVGGKTFSVTAFAGDSKSLYIGGSFTNVGGVAARNLARWDGTNWYVLGNGWPGTVNALALNGDSLYVGGKWTNSTGQTIYCVRRWDGTNWFNLGSDIQENRRTQIVTALCSTGESLWVGGRFTLSGGKPAASIARWVESPQLTLTPFTELQTGTRKIQLDLDPGLTGFLETSTNLQLWSQLPAKTNFWLMDKSDVPGQWFFRAAIKP